MDIKSAIVLCAILAIVLTQKAELLVGQQNLRNNWQTMQKYLNNQQVIKIYSQDLTQDSIMKVLALELPLVQQLHFCYWDPDGEIDQRNLQRPPTILTHRLTKALFKSKFFHRLKVLNLKDTNIDDRYLAFLSDMNLTTSISQLNLENCFIGARGYQHLSNIKFTNLTHLNISNTLLAEGEAVDALITIICGNNTNSCENKLQDLDLSQTAITRQHFVRLMRRLNPDPLRSLILTKLSLIYTRTYKEGYNYSAFAVLAQRFKNLQYLQFQDCMLNDQIATLFKNWSLPNLNTLNVAKNHITDKGVKLWINKQNLPQLEVLALFSNEVGDDTITHLIEQDFEFTKFFFGDCRITSKGIQDLTRLSTHRLQKLLIQMHISDQLLGNIINQGDFPNLQELIIIKNDLLTHFFTNINWKRVPKLKILSLQLCNIKESFKHAIDSIQKQPKDWFPNLRMLVLTDASLTDDIAMLALITLPLMFPKLQQFIVYQDDLEPEKFINIALANSNFSEGTYININSLKLSKRGNQFELYSLPSLNFLFYSENENDYTTQAVLSKIPVFVNIFDFSKLTDVQLYSKNTIDLFFRIMQEAKIGRLSHLRSLRFYQPMDIDFLTAQLGDIQMPAVRTLNIPFVVPADVDQDYVGTVLEFFNRFKNLNNLLMNADFLDEQRGFLMRKEFLDSLQFSFLFNIAMNEQNMEAQQVANFVRNHNQTLRQINMNNNFMETQLLKILVQEQIVLDQLSLQSTSFVVNEFAILGKVDTKFLRNLNLRMCDLTNEHVLAMLSQNKTGPFFPKLENLQLSSNDIRKEGLSALLATGMHHLRILDIKQNSNPQFINIILTYPTRIMGIEAKGVQIYGIQENLDPSSALNIQKITLQARSFLREDFRSLAKLNFWWLQQGQYEIYNAYDCEVLADLLKINERSSFPQIYFANDEPGLNSSCLANASYQSSIFGINIFSKYGNTYLPEFVQRMMNTTLQIKLISLVDTLLPPDFFSRVFSRPFQQLQGLYLSYNYLGDAVARDFFKRSFPNLQILSLKSVDITDAALDTISRSSMPQLKLLILDGNKITARGIKSLNNMKNIAVLSLKACELDRQALQMVGKLQSQSLLAIMLGNNLFSGTDLVNFVSNLDGKALPSLRFLDFQGITLTKEEHQAISTVLSPKSIQVEMDDPINVVRVNSAGY